MSEVLVMLLLLSYYKVLLFNLNVNALAHVIVQLFTVIVLTAAS